MSNCINQIFSANQLTHKRHNINNNTFLGRRALKVSQANTEIFRAFRHRKQVGQRVQTLHRKSCTAFVPPVVALFQVSLFLYPTSLFVYFSPFYNNPSRSIVLAAQKHSETKHIDRCIWIACKGGQFREQSSSSSFVTLV